MRRLLGSTLLLVLITISVTAQTDRSRIYTNPTLPCPEILDRLNLKLAWSAQVPLAGGRDGIYEIQNTGRSLLIQTRSGLLMQIDAITGVVQWHTRVGIPYRGLFHFAYNTSSVFVLNNNYLYALDRRDGSVQFQTNLPVAISAPFIADEDLIYGVTAGGQIRVYRLPNFDIEKEKALEAAERAFRDRQFLQQRVEQGNTALAAQLELTISGQILNYGPQPQPFWSQSINYLVDYQPTLTRDVVVFTGSGGTISGFSKVPGPEGLIPLIFRWSGNGEITARPGRYGDIVYVPSSDSNVYAIDANTGHIMWRHTAGSPIVRTPFATAEDVYVTSDRGGLSRLDRLTGKAQWRFPACDTEINSQPFIDQVLAVNPKFVYANDKSGRLVILDRIRGNFLSCVDLRDFVVLSPNRWTDRIILAAQNGLIICLHDKEYVRPVYQQPLIDIAFRRLNRPVMIRPIEGIALKEVLKNLSVEYQIKIFISQAAFRDLGLDPIDDKLVVTPRIEARNMKEALDQLLAGREFNAIVEVLNDTLMILPRPRAEVPPERKAPDK